MEPHKITMHKKVRKQRSELRGLDFRCHDVSARRWPPHHDSRDRVSTYSSSDHTSAHSISLFYISHISLRTSLTLLSISFSLVHMNISQTVSLLIRWGHFAKHTFYPFSLTLSYIYIYIIHFIYSLLSASFPFLFR